MHCLYEPQDSLYTCTIVSFTSPLLTSSSPLLTSSSPLLTSPHNSLSFSLNVLSGVSVSSQSLLEVRVESLYKGDARADSLLIVDVVHLEERNEVLLLLPHSLVKEPVRRIRVPGLHVCVRDRV